MGAMARQDPHSYNDDTQPRTERLEWRARVDFSTRRLHAQATLHLEEASPGPLDLDTRDLDIEAVEDASGRALPFHLYPPEPILGRRLRVELPPGVRQLTVRYRTAPQASALQWLEPEQTAGRRHPFLFSQCQAIHARSVVPLQDTPRIRIRYQAELVVPRALQAVMAAGFTGREEQGEEAVVRFDMPQPIPPYLLAFAVGDLASKELGPRSRVWAEPELLEASAWEFAEVEDMLRAAEALFGPYDWERFDVLTMPPSFPYGGMENPRLTFLTPTVVAGDRSLVAVVAHELAHSWTGNLVTNASAEHFWLNEGFTVFAERRIVEALYGKEEAALHAALGRRWLERALQQFSKHPELTLLRTRLEGVDPDEAFSQVPYEKGYLFLRALEEAVGREAFDTFLKRYLSAHRFQALTTEQFLAYTERELPGALAKVGAEAWIYQPGVPANAPVARSEKLERVERLKGKAVTVEEARGWTPAEWLLYLEGLPEGTGRDTFRVLDERFKLTESRNAEVLVTWLSAAVKAGWQPAVERARGYLGEVGRMKFLKPLYGALHARADTKPLAQESYGQYSGRYHPIARHVVEKLLKQ